MKAVVIGLSLVLTGAVASTAALAETTKKVVIKHHGGMVKKKVVIKHHGPRHEKMIVKKHDEG